jgi:3'-phosphoadenosine 5'-phosphosulfate sulfotransferase (PAPS reductase)/FAD synthetase
MQALPLEAKIYMTEQRIRTWLDSWARFDIVNKKTGKTRFVTWDTRAGTEPPLKENEYIDTVLFDWVYLSFSGGKDSTVLDDILTKMGLGGDVVPRVFCDTGLEYPEVRMFATKKADAVLRPEMRFDQVLKTYGYPVVGKEVSKKIREARGGAPGAVNCIKGLNLDGTQSSFRQRFVKYAPLVETDFKISDQCCDVMKKKPFKAYEKETGRVPILATMAQESRLRAMSWMKNGCNAFDAKRSVSTPMAFWTEQDVLRYIKKSDLPIASVYGDIVPADGPLLLDLNANKLKTTGTPRTGCIFCPIGAHCNDRFEQMKETHPRQWNYCIGGGQYDEAGLWTPSKEGLGLGHIFDEMNAIYGEGFINYGKTTEEEQKGGSTNV